MNIQSINASMLWFFQERLLSMGIKEGGLENYYNRRIDEKNIIAPVDLCLINIIQRRYSYLTVIHEMACGAAQLAHALWLLGYRTSASEIDDKRYRLAVDLGNCLSSRCKITYGNSFLIETNADLYITVNAATATMGLPNSLKFIEQKLSDGSDIIFKADLYGENQGDNRKTLSDTGIKYTELENNFLLLRSRDNV